ncbi:MAG: hypothetical protein WCG02_04305 [Candidatus Taylorbacteria bacterium]
MKYTNKTKYSIIAAIFAVAFLAVIVSPTGANACYGGDCYSRSVPFQYVTEVSTHTPRPIYVPQPIYYPQPVVIQQPVYYPQPVYYSPLTVSCSANTTYTYNTYNSYNNPVTWTAYVSGGNGYYSYSWSGSDSLYGTNQSVYFNYTYPGTKYAYVTVYSNGQSVTQSCNTYVQNSYVAYTQPIIQQPVYVQPIVQQPVYVQPVARQTNASLDIGCYVDPSNAKVNQPVTWSVEVTGGMAPYTYTWSGTDNLTGSESSVIKYYSTTGSKSAIVSVTSADGRTGSRACSNTLTVSKVSEVAYKAPVKISSAPVVNTPVAAAPAVSAPQANNANLAAASLFSLSNVPWGWVAVLVILLLFVTIMYLLLNRQKI